MDLVSKIVFTVLIVLWATFLCTVGRWSLSSFYDTDRYPRDFFLTEVLFTDEGAVRPVSVFAIYGTILAVLWFL